MQLAHMHVHTRIPALTQHEIKEFLKPAFDQARELQLQPNTKCLSEIPFVTVRYYFLLAL